MMNLYHSVLFFVAACLCCDTAASIWPNSCCLKKSTGKIPLGRVVRYTVQNAGLCPFNAIRFHTKRERTLCYNPDSDEVKKAMKDLDARKETEASMKPKGNCGKNKKCRKQKGKGKRKQ